MEHNLVLEYTISKKQLITLNYPKCSFIVDGVCARIIIVELRTFN